VFALDNPECIPMTEPHASKVNKSIFTKSPKNNPISISLKIITVRTDVDCGIGGISDTKGGKITKHTKHAKISLIRIGTNFSPKPGQTIKKAPILHNKIRNANVCPARNDDMSYVISAM